MALRQKPSPCDGCKFADKGEGFVGPEGPKDAKLVVIGEAPGKNEIIQGRPFIGASGQLLTDLLREVGIARETVYITNAVKCRPSTKGANPTLPWVRECRKRHLVAEFKDLRPNLIALMGNAALCASGATPQIKGILAWDGSVFALPDDSALGTKRKAIAMLHPAALVSYHRMRKRLPISRKHFRRLAQEAERPGLPQGPKGLDPNPRAKRVIAWIREARCKRKALAFDIETSGLSYARCRLLCISLSDGHWSPSIDLTEGESAVTTEIWAYLADPAITKITQNGVFDASVLALHGHEVAGPIIDTCYLHHSLQPELPHSLAFLGSLYTSVPYYKNETKDESGKRQDMALVPPEELRLYNARDSYVTYCAAAALWREAKDSGQGKALDLYKRIVGPLIPCVTDMQITGIRLSAPRQTKLAMDMGSEIAKLRKNVELRLRQPDFNIASRDQLAKLIFDVWRYVPVSFTDVKHRPKVDDETFKTLLREQVKDAEHRVIIQTIQRILRLTKLRSTFVESLRADGDGRVRANWSIHGTRTGRLSCKQPNLQNQPKALRAMYVPSDGRIFVNIDFRAFEQWGMALMANDEPLLRALREGQNPHCQNVAAIFNLPYNEVAKRYADGDPAIIAQYSVMKNYVYGSNYGAQPRKILRIMSAKMDDPPTLEVVTQIHHSYAIAHPKITAMRNDIERRLRRSRRLVGAFGRVRTFMGAPDDIITEGYNYPIQNLAADITNQCHIELFDSLGPGIIVAQVHDSFLFDVPKDRVAEIVREARRIMTQPFRFKDWWGGTVEQRFPIDISIGPSWLDLTSYNDPA